jgi:hypothetical protein
MSTIRDWLAYRLFLIWPPGCPKGWVNNVSLWLSPYAVNWAYRDHDFGDQP